MTAADTSSRGWILAALMATMALAAMDATIVSTAIPDIVNELGGFSLFTWVFSIYLLAQTVTIPLYGKLADMYGRKPVLIVGLSIFLLGSAACALSWDMLSLIGFRALQGLGAGSIMATVNTLAGDLYAVEERGRVQGWLSSVWGVSAIVGPTLGGTFADYVAWQWIFLINLPIGAVALFLIGKYLHENIQARPHQMDYAGATLVLLTIGLFVFGLLQGGTAWAWTSLPSLGIFTTVALLCLITLHVEKHAAEPILPGWLWKRRVLTSSNLAMVGMGIVMMGPIAYLPTFAQSVYGLGAIAAGLVLAVTSLGWPLASAASPSLYLKIGFRDAALIGSLVIILAAGGFLLLPDNASIWWVVLDQFMLGVGYGLLSTPLLVGIQSVVGWSQRGQVTGANMFSRFLGQTLGAAIFGALFNAALREKLTGASATIDAVSININEVVQQLHQSSLPIATEQFLRLALLDATRHIYAGLLVFAFLTLLCICMAPKQFPLVPDDTP